MSDVLQKVREKYPQYENVSDEELTLRIGSKYPQYLDRDPQFKQDFQTQVGTLGLKAAISGQGALLNTLTSPAAGEASEMGRQEGEAVRETPPPILQQLAGTAKLTPKQREEAIAAFQASPIPEVHLEGKTTAGKIGAAAVNVADQLARGVVSPMGAFLAPLGMAGAVPRAAMGVGFGAPLVKAGLKKVYEGAATGDTQAAMEGALETVAGGSMVGGAVHEAIPRAQIAETAKVAPLTAQALQQQVTGEALKMPEGAKPETVTKPVERTTPDASSITKTTEVYGDVRPREEPASGVPVTEGGEGVQPQAEGRLPTEAQEPKPPTEQATVAKPEQIVSAAYRDESGNVTTGPHHPAILEQLGIKGFESRESRNTPQFGFVTDSGRFVTRDEAAPLAEKSGQKLTEFEGPPHSDEIASKPGGETPISETKQEVAPALTPDQEYDASRATFKQAYKDFIKLREDYRLEKIGDEEFLKAKAAFKQAQEVADAAETKFIDAKNKEADAAKEPGVSPVTTADVPEASSTLGTGSTSPATPEPTVEAKGGNPFDTSATSQRLTELRDSKPRPINKLYGPNPTPEQVASQSARIKEWNREYRKAQKAHKEMVAKSNEWIRNNTEPPPPVSGPVTPEPAVAAQKVEPVESRKPTQILGESARVKVSVPEGATMLRVTDTKGRTSTLSLSEVNKGDNPFHGVEVRKLEAGSIGKDKKFNAVKGDVEVKDLAQGPGTGAGPGSPAVSQGPDPKAQIEALEESFRGVAGKKISLLDQIRQASNIGQRAAQAKDVLSTAISGLKATGDYLIKKWEGVKNWDDMLKAKGELSSEIEKRGWRVRQFVKTVQKAMPDKGQRAAIAKWVDAGGDKAELERGAAETKPEFRQAYLDAMNLKGDDLIAAQNIRNYFESRLDEAIDAGVLEHGVEDYLHRIYERDPNAAKKMIAYVQAGVIKPNPALAKKRVFQADWEAEKLGYKPVQDFLPRVADYEASLTKAIASRAFIRKTLDMKASDGRPIIDVKGVGIPIEDASGVREATLIKPKSNPVKSNDPADAANYRGDYVNREYPSLSKWKWAGTDAAGKPIFLQGDVAIHPQYVGRIDSLLEPSRIRYAKKPLARAVARTAIGVSSTVKQTMLDFSGFHQVQITVHGLEHRVLPWKIVQDIDFQNPNVDGLLKGGVTLGGEYYGGNLSEGLVGRSLSRMIPGLGPLMQSYHEWLFQSYIPRIKMTMALHALERNRSRYAGKMSDEQIFAKTAAEANSAFGELNYITLERSQTARDISRIILLAPDFLEARGRFAGGALEKGGKSFGQEQRTALLLGALTMYVTARLVNKATDDQYHFEPENAFSIIHGNKAYGLRTVQGDILHLLERPYQFWLSRLNPVFGRTLLEAATQRDYFGRKRTLPQQAWDAVSTMMPIALRTGRERALWESLLNGFGVTARRWNDVDDAFKLAQEWKKKNLPRSKWEKGEFIYDPDKDALRGLKVALSNGDDGGAVKEIKKLIESKTITHQELNRYFDRYATMPFTGSQANDRKFLAGLTEDQRKTVTAAREHKKQIRRLYRNAYGQYSDAVNQAAPQ